MHPAGYEPMLATASRQMDGEGWAFEPKLDGWRAIVHVGENGSRSTAGPAATSRRTFRN